MALDRLAKLYPNSGYAQSLDMTGTARTWAMEMNQIPAEAVLECYRRTMNNWVGTFPPSIGDFRKTWLSPDWDYWAEANRVEEADIAAIAALPPGPPAAEGPGLRTHRAQFAHLSKHGCFVCCDCQDQFGVHPPCLRTPDEKFWICAAFKCDFRLPFGETKPVLNIVPSPAPQPKAPPKPKEPTPAEKLADVYGLPFHAMDERQIVRLRQIADWLGGDFEAAKELFPTLSDLQAEWIKSRKK